MIYEILKRTMDIGVSLAVALVFSPIILLTIIAIKLDSDGPVIYKQKRVGRYGKTFDMWKFRSMIDNADSFLLKNEQFLKQFKKKEGWKFDDAGADPRITRVGRFIRKYSFDELPQLWNIFIGDMSIVGPRPYRNDVLGNEIEEQLKLYPHLRNKVEEALSVRPGLSGPWQTSGRNELSWDKRVEFDAQYAKDKSILKDLKIVFKTPLAMFNKW